MNIIIEQEELIKDKVKMITDLPWYFRIILFFKFPSKYECWTEKLHCVFFKNFNNTSYVYSHYIYSDKVNDLDSFKKEIKKFI